MLLVRVMPKGTWTVIVGDEELSIILVLYFFFKKKMFEVIRVICTRKYSADERIRSMSSPMTATRVTCATSDGAARIEYIVVQPKDAVARCPVVLLPHGGPVRFDNGFY